jgi:NAD(P)H-quinone oxidoreductase subunit H
MDGWIKV